MLGNVLIDTVVLHFGSRDFFLGTVAKSLQTGPWSQGPYIESSELAHVLEVEHQDVPKQ